MLHHGLADGGHHLAAQDDIALDGGVAQIQIAVFQPLSLVGLPAVVDLKGQLVVAAAAQNADLGGDHLDLAGGQLGIFAGALPHHAGDLQGGLLVQALDLGQQRGVLHQKLGGAVKVPQHHEGQTSGNEPDIFHKAGQRYRLARVGQPKLAAGMGSGLHHNCSTPMFCFFDIQCQSCRITVPLLRAASAAFSWGISCSTGSVCCVPAARSLQLTTPWAISSSPRKTA